jgi:hypothetical protein
MELSFLVASSSSYTVPSPPDLKFPETFYRSVAVSSWHLSWLLGYYRLCSLLDVRGRKWREAGEDCIMRSFTTGTLQKYRRTIKWRRMQWAGYVARMGEVRNVYSILVGNPEGKRPLARRKCRWEDPVKMKNDMRVCTGFRRLRMEYIDSSSGHSNELLVS